MHGGILTKISDTLAETVGIDKQQVRDAVSSTVSVASTVAMAIPGLQIAAIGMKVLGSDKADGKAVEGVLEKIKDPEKRKHDDIDLDGLGPAMAREATAKVKR
jgi:hypothetical protein